MKQALLFLLLAFAAPFAAAGQNIALGERVPKVENPVWLDGREPAAAPLTYLEFYHSSNNAAATSLRQLKALSDKTGAKLRVIVLTKEPAGKVAPLLRPYLSERFAAVLDAAKGFEAFGVAYVPFGVLVDARNRALWMGNSLQMNEKLFEKITR